MDFLFETIGPFKAGELYKLVQVPAKQGLPSFANQEAKPLPKWKELGEKSSGPGIYAVFCKNKLAYVGIYTGNKKGSFNGTVGERWNMHLTFFGLRSPRVSFAPTRMKEILDNLTGEPSETYASILGGRTVSLERLIELQNGGHNLLKKGGNSCTYKKAKYATLNWDVFGPGNEEIMLSEVSFIYSRILPTNELLARSMDVGGHNDIKERLLKPIESNLISTLKPICNSETKSGTERLDVSLGEYQRYFDAIIGRKVAA